MQLASGAWVLPAGDRGVGVIVLDADVASDATNHRIEVATPSLGGHVGIGDEGAIHAHRVRLAGGDELVGLHRIDDATGRDHGRTEPTERIGVVDDDVVWPRWRRHDQRPADVGRGVTGGHVKEVDITCDRGATAERRPRWR